MVLQMNFLDHTPDTKRESQSTKTPMDATWASIQRTSKIMASVEADPNYVVSNANSTIADIVETAYVRPTQQDHDSLQGIGNAESAGLRNPAIEIGDATLDSIGVVRPDSSQDAQVE